MAWPRTQPSLSPESCLLPLWPDQPEGLATESILPNHCDIRSFKRDWIRCTFKPGRLFSVLQKHTWVRASAQNVACYFRLPKLCLHTIPHSLHHLPLNKWWIHGQGELSNHSKYASFTKAVWEGLLRNYWRFDAEEDVGISHRVHFSFFSSRRKRIRLQDEHDT